MASWLHLLLRLFLMLGNTEACNCLGLSPLLVTLPQFLLLLFGVTLLLGVTVGLDG